MFSSILRKNEYPDLFEWFCVKTLKLCCSPGTYGPDCLGAFLLREIPSPTSLPLFLSQFLGDESTEGTWGTSAFCRVWDPAGRLPPPSPTQLGALCTLPLQPHHSPHALV